LLVALIAAIAAVATRVAVPAPQRHARFSVPFARGIERLQILGFACLSD
jgi:hypothetical protein